MVFQNPYKKTNKKSRIGSKKWEKKAIQDRRSPYYMIFYTVGVSERNGEKGPCKNREKFSPDRER
jgi:hypothetical protein